MLWQYEDAVILMQYLTVEGKISSRLSMRKSKSTPWTSNTSSGCGFYLLVITPKIAGYDTQSFPEHKSAVDKN